MFRAEAERADLRLALQGGIWLSLALLTVAISVGFGLWKISESFSGPFKSEASGWYVVQLQQSALARIIGDSRGDLVYFALTDGIPNSRDLTATVAYSVKVRAKVLAGIGVLVGALIWLRLFVGYHTGKLAGFAAQWKVGISLLLQGSIWALVAASAFYAGSIVYGAIIGDALPTATLLRHPWFEWLSAAEPFVGVALLLFAGFGVRRRLGGWDPAWHAATRETEQGVAWRFRWCFVFCCFR